VVNKSRLREIYDIGTPENTFNITITLKFFRNRKLKSYKFRSKCALK